MDHALNAAFFSLHTAWVLFNAVGWMWRKTRPWHLATMTLTAISWFALGYWYGWGYCVCTDWHWRVRERLGYRDDPDSYMQLLAAQVLGLDPGPWWADVVTGSAFALAFAATILLNGRDLRGARTR